MSLLMLNRSVPKGISICVLRNSNANVRNGVNLAQAIYQKEYNTLNNTQKIRSLRSLLSKFNVKNVSSVRQASTTDDHRALWTLEKVISIALAGVIPYGIISPNPVMDNLMALFATVHIHWGLEAIVVDYVRPSLFGPVIPKVSLIALYVLSAATLGGLYYYNYTNIGIGKTIRKIWEAKETA